MEALLAQVIIGFAALLFAVMAIGPLLVEASSSSRVSIDEDDDRVLSIVPVSTLRETDSLAARRRRGRTTIDEAGTERRSAA